MCGRLYFPHIGIFLQSNLSVPKININFAEIFNPIIDKMKKIFLPLVIVMAVMFMNSCETSKQVPYMQNIDSISLAASQYLFDARIKPKDELHITVHTTDPAVSAPFNLFVSRRMGTTGELGSGAGSLQGYLVDNDGTINFPVIGRVSVVGLTKTQCENLLQEKLAPYLAKTEKPVVTVRMSTFRVTLLGDFSSPKVVAVTSENVPPATDAADSRRAQ